LKNVANRKSEKIKFLLTETKLKGTT